MEINGAGSRVRIRVNAGGGTAVREDYGGYGSKGGFLIIVFSTITPTTAAQEKEANKLSQKELKKAKVAAAEKAPII